MPEGSFVVVQPEAGIARADKALAAFRRELDVREAGASARTSSTRTSVVVTAGSWVNELLDEPLPVTTTRETLCYFRPDAGGRPVPSVVSFKPGRHTHEMYSLHDPEHGLKVGAHHAGPQADPNVPGEPEPGADRAHHRLGERDLRLAEPEPVAAETCMYTTTADESFVLERRGRVVVGSPCSGHGFKFAPAIGERLADLALSNALTYPSPVPYYQRLGEVPRKRHIQFRDNGTLLTEEVMGLEGFRGTSRSSIT